MSRLANNILLFHVKGEFDRIGIEHDRVGGSRVGRGAARATIPRPLPFLNPIEADTAVQHLLDDIRRRRAARVGVILRLGEAGEGDCPGFSGASSETTGTVPSSTQIFTAVPVFISPAHIPKHFLYDIGPIETFPAAWKDTIDYFVSIYLDFRIDRRLEPWILTTRSVIEWICAEIDPALSFKQTTPKRTGACNRLAGLPCYIIEEQQPPRA